MEDVLDSIGLKEGNYCGLNNVQRIINRTNVLVAEKKEKGKESGQMRKSEVMLKKQKTEERKEKQLEKMIFAWS